MTKREIDNLIRKINSRLDSLVNRFGQNFIGYKDLVLRLNDFYDVAPTVTSGKGIIHLSRTQPTDEEAKLRLEKVLKKLDYETSVGSINNLLKAAKDDLDKSIGPVPKGRVYKEMKYQRAKDVAYVKYWLNRILIELYTSDDNNQGNSTFDGLTELLQRRGFGKNKDVTYEEYYHVLVPIVNKYYPNF